MTAAQSKRVLIRVRLEIRRWLREITPSDDRQRGQLEAMRYLDTVIRNQMPSRRAKP